MSKINITPEIIVAYSQCPRKAFFLIFSQEQEKTHDYSVIIEERRQQNRNQHLEDFRQLHPDAKKFEKNTFKKYKFLVEASLKSDGLDAYCDILIKREDESSRSQTSYEPTIIVGTHTVTKEQRIELIFVGIVLERFQNKLSKFGRVVCFDKKEHRVNLKNGYETINYFLKSLQSWLSKPPIESPPLILNKHCKTCRFQELCLKQAQDEDNLSLLDHMTPKAIKKYNKRGIFTINQLSYLFRPRRNRKKRKVLQPVKHSLELQALAIREQKIYVSEISDLNRQPIELFLDVEGRVDSL